MDTNIENKEGIKSSTKVMIFLFGLIVLVTVALGIASGLFGLEELERNNQNSNNTSIYNNTNSTKSPF